MILSVLLTLLTLLNTAQCLIDETKIRQLRRSLECPSCTEAANFLIRHCGQIPSSSEYFQSYFECVCELDKGFFIMFERCIDECDSFDFLHIDSNSSTDLHNHYCDIAEKISEGLVTLLQTTNHGSIEVYATETCATSEEYGTNTEECVGETANGEAPAITETDSRFVLLRPRILLPGRRCGRSCRTRTRNCVGTIKVNLVLLVALYLI